MTMTTTATSPIENRRPSIEEIQNIGMVLDTKRALDRGWDTIRIAKELMVPNETIVAVEEGDYWWIDNVLDKGYVRLVDWMGEDLAVVNAARASFAKESFEMTTADARLVNFLGREGHFSCFRHNFLTLEVKAPLEVTRQWWKYVTGSAHTDSFSTAWNEACFPGSQSIKTWGGYDTTVEKLYSLYQQERKNKTALRSVDDNGNIVKNRINAIWKSGTKKVYRVTSELGFTIESTDDHRYMTPTGYKELKDIRPGDMVMMNGIPAYKDSEWLEERYVKQGMTQKDIGELANCSPHTIRKWVRKFGLQQDQVKRMQDYNRVHGVYGKGQTAVNNPALKRRALKGAHKMRGRPAYANGDKHHAWKGDSASTSAGYKRAQKMFNGICEICAEQAEIHHIDRDPLNNVDDNIKMFCSGHHHMEHGHQVAMRAHQVPVKSIEYVGEFDVYDIEMENEPNLVINQFVVHNSRRYVTMEPEFYIPEVDEWRSMPESRKQGSGGPIDPGTGSLLSDELENYAEEGRSLYQWAMEELGVAPEVARLFLPAYGMYTTWRWSTSMQGLAFFLSQRLEEGAQSEIQKYANKIDIMAHRIWPLGVQALLTGLGREYDA